MLQTVLINVSGKVQGVFYRQSTREKAIELGIQGKVLNLPNGDVQIIATGAKDRINSLLKWCEQGPPKASVDKVSHSELPLQTFNSFYIEKL